MNLWTIEEISKIFIQLDRRKLPFEGYTFSFENGKPVVLGHGGSADVYAGIRRRSGKGTYAIKVVGFRGSGIESDMFNSSVKLHKKLSLDPDNRIVAVYDYRELWVTLDEHDDVTDVSLAEPKGNADASIKLQFIVMENLPSVISRTKDFNIKLTPEKLSEADEREVVRLAYDIGTALRKLHSKNILHRDVKLENVFYSEKDKSYKLGDFGIAKKTRSGFADTVAFTKGYVAPEVLTTSADDSYDNTADIYSFGMMLYVLMNGMKFPESETYNVNFKVQYREDYVLPRPERISDGLFRIISKMCMYNPNDRYQSMNDVMIDIGKLRYDSSVSYKMQHNAASLLGGLILMAAGVGIYKYLNGYHWSEALFISFAAVLLIQFFMIRENDAFTYKMYFKRRIYWIAACASYFILSFLNRALTFQHKQYAMLFGSHTVDSVIDFLERYNLDIVGICGLALCIFWIVREWLLRTSYFISSRISLIFLSVSMYFLRK